MQASPRQVAFLRPLPRKRNLESERPDRFEQWPPLESSELPAAEPTLAELDSALAIVSLHTPRKMFGPARREIHTPGTSSDFVRRLEPPRSLRCEEPRRRWLAPAAQLTRTEVFSLGHPVLVEGAKPPAAAAFQRAFRQRA